MIISLISQRHPCVNFLYERFMLEVFQNTLEEINPFNRGNINLFWSSLKRDVGRSMLNMSTSKT
jgi:hypothetical protein